MFVPRTHFSRSGTLSPPILPLLKQHPLSSSFCLPLLPRMQPTQKSPRPIKHFPLPPSTPEVEYPSFSSSFSQRCGGSRSGVSLPPSPSSQEASFLIFYPSGGGKKPREREEKCKQRLLRAVSRGEGEWKRSVSRRLRRPRRKCKRPRREKKPLYLSCLFPETTFPLEGIANICDKMGSINAFLQVERTFANLLLSSSVFCTRDIVCKFESPLPQLD